MAGRRNRIVRGGEIRLDETNCPQTGGRRCEKEQDDWKGKIFSGLHFDIIQHLGESAESDERIDIACQVSLKTEFPETRLKAKMEIKQRLCPLVTDYYYILNLLFCKNRQQINI